MYSASDHFLFFHFHFHVLSHGVIHFVRSVSMRKRFLVGWNSSTANQKTSISRFLKLTLRTKWIVPCERAWQTVLKKGGRNCVQLCLQSLEPLERCATRALSMCFSLNAWFRTFLVFHAIYWDFSRPHAKCMNFRVGTLAEICIKAPNNP